jgi:hypothetical protein
MQAMSAPVMTFLMERGLVVPGDKMPYGDELLKLLRGTADAHRRKDPEAVRVGDDLDRAPATAEATPVAGTCDGPGGTGGVPA